MNFERANDPPTISPCNCCSSGLCALRFDIELFRPCFIDLGLFSALAVGASFGIAVLDRLGGSSGVERRLLAIVVDVNRHAVLQHRVTLIIELEFHGFLVSGIRPLPWPSGRFAAAHPRFGMT
ncbi:MAG: hypothetical protein IPH50_10900 [Rhodanobacteraceae bacterium]|nr:hypothetical protein [Rhodanobacteraceae bacterium]